MRKLQPCGTRAAYARHLYNKETPCAECKAANVERVAGIAERRATANGVSMNSINREVLKLEQAMAENPPIIRWRFDPILRIQVAWYVDDPYMDHPTE